jgi:hypothetical protein
MSPRREVFLGKDIPAGSEQIEQRVLSLVPGLLARSFPTYLQRPVADVADAPFPIGGITSAFGYDQFEHWKMMAQQKCSVPRTIKMKGFSRADLNRQPLKPDSIKEKSAGCIDTRHTGA